MKGTVGSGPADALPQQPDLWLCFKNAHFWNRSAKKLNRGGCFGLLQEQPDFTGAVKQSCSLETA